MVDLKGKRILFVGTGFFDYEECIRRELENRGAKVFYFSSSIQTLHTYLLMRVGKASDVPEAVSDRLAYLINCQPANIDIVFIIKANNFLERHVNLIKKKYPNSPIYLYLWDSLTNHYNKEIILNNFEKIFTFDRKDAEDYNFKFRPLFYSITGNFSQQIEYDISFVGSEHTIRYDFLRKISPLLDDAGLTFKFVLYTGKLRYFLGRFMNKTIPSRNKGWFVLNPISYDEYINISKLSNVILDIANPNQTGLTMRTIETIGLGKKIVSTNSEIERYSIDKRLYRVVDASSPYLDIDFLRERKKVNYDATRFSLKSFVNDIFSD